ncbi:hypothetical protein BDY21DRAFT_102996 [Lineolata rhizophorae]|uniref:Uncharacterized protein n=1 Tax=Lineolata rhizophorae TaxID=578093 RepID=A0A6A6NT12_9PEZI|nr:hypothetical protein BDY21DRAFT_102996 [Lineolata rhizophorae]
MQGTRLVATLPARAPACGERARRSGLWEPSHEAGRRKAESDAAGQMQEKPAPAALRQRLCGGAEPRSAERRRLPVGPRASSRSLDHRRRPPRPPPADHLFPTQHQRPSPLRSSSRLARLAADRETAPPARRCCLLQTTIASLARPLRLGLSFPFLSALAFSPRPETSEPQLLPPFTVVVARSGNTFLRPIGLS